MSSVLLTEWKKIGGRLREQLVKYSNGISEVLTFVSFFSNVPDRVSDLCIGGGG